MLKSKREMDAIWTFGKRVHPNLARHRLFEKIKPYLNLIYCINNQPLELISFTLLPIAPH
jgi:hypothetical protein